MIRLLIENGNQRVIVEADPEGLMGLQAILRNATTDGADSVLLPTGQRLIIRQVEGDTA